MDSLIGDGPDSSSAANSRNKFEKPKVSNFWNMTINWGFQTVNFKSAFKPHIGPPRRLEPASQTSSYPEMSILDGRVRLLTMLDDATTLSLSVLLENDTVRHPSHPGNYYRSSSK